MLVIVRMLQRFVMHCIRAEDGKNELPDQTDTISSFVIKGSNCSNNPDNRDEFFLCHLLSKTFKHWLNSDHSERIAKE